MTINLCIPVLKRYDLLKECIESAESGSVIPDRYYIVDNGGAFDGALYSKEILQKMYLLRPDRNLGVAASWNMFIENLDDYIIICNDDIKFFYDTIEKLVDAFDENFIKFPAGIPSANSFSCFLFPKKMCDVVGYFDETISPNYAYYEDNDYHYRMLQKGLTIAGVENCRLDHFGSATLKAMTPDETSSHHKKFEYATKMYLAKWGGLPGKEKYTQPWNSGPGKDI